MLTRDPNYRDKVSQMVSWGHWFALFNILLSLLIGSRYLFLMDWPPTLLGRVYALVSWLGQFGFIGFAGYLLILFPLTFVVMSQRLLRFLAAAYATAALTLLMLDTEVFSRFHLHLNTLVWDILISPDQGELSRDWQWLFILAPVLFMVEMLLGTWAWQKLRSLNRRTFAKPIVIVLFCSFIASHLSYIWADATFYRPITMQKTNLPLSYPMTARRFLEKHGWLNAQEYQRKLSEKGNPAAQMVDYPKSPLLFSDKGTGYNLLFILVEGLRQQDVAQDMPQLTQFAQQNLSFNQHFSSGNRSDTGLLGLFYGISPSYIEGIVAGKKSPLLLTALTQQGYQFGLFSGNGFNRTFEQRTLFANQSLPNMSNLSNATLTAQWQQWLSQQSNATPWFSYLSYPLSFETTNTVPPKQAIQRYQQAAQSVDHEIQRVLETLAAQGKLENTIVVITAKHGIEYNDSRQNSWGSGQNFSQAQLRVPLVIHWPNMLPQRIDKMTSHEDVMRTLMERMLHVKTPPQDYSQGEDLFTSQRQKNWLALGDQKQLVVVTPENTLVILPNGHYTIYDPEYQKLPHEQPQLALLLQVFTDIKRFIAD